MQPVEWSNWFSMILVFPNQQQQLLPTSIMTAYRIHDESHSGTNFTTGLWAHNWNFANIIFAEIIIRKILSVHKFAHIATAELSWYAHISDTDGIIIFSSESDIYIYWIWIMSSETVRERGPRCQTVEIHHDESALCAHFSILRQFPIYYWTRS